MFARFTFAAIAAAATVAATAAYAQPIGVWGDNDKTQARVTYSDSEVRTLSGAKALAFRIRVAAARVCGADDPIVRSGWRFADCRESAIDRAVRTLGSSLVADALGRQTTLATATHR